MLDLHLAFAHHLLAFAILGILAAELAVLYTPLGAGALHALTRIDALYGLSAMLLVAIGLCRAVFAAKGWLYYAQNLFFWAKVATFATVGLISIRPTLRYIAWGKRAKAVPGQFPAACEITPVRRLVLTEMALFALIPLFAAAMARGLGQIDP